MTDTIDKFGSGTVAVQQMANTSGVRYKLGMNRVDLASALRDRGIILGTGFDNSEK